MDDRIITHAMLEAEMMDKIEQLEADLTQAVQMYEDAAGERDRTIAVLAECQMLESTVTGMLKETEAALAVMTAERDAAVARLRYLYDDTMSKLIWHDKPPISFDQYAFNIDAARKEEGK